jgi:hypothetical protein
MKTRTLPHLPFPLLPLGIAKLLLDEKNFWRM